MPPRAKNQKAPDICPVCGEDVPSKSLACPECGADHNSGWRDDAYDGLELPDGDFNYDEFIQNEFGSSSRPHGIKPIWWITGIVLLVALAVFFLLQL